MAESEQGAAAATGDPPGHLTLYQQKLWSELDYLELSAGYSFLGHLNDHKHDARLHFVVGVTATAATAAGAAGVLTQNFALLAGSVTLVGALLTGVMTFMKKIRVCHRNPWRPRMDKPVWRRVPASKEPKSRNHSDVDYFVKFYDSKPTPQTALARIKSSMQSLYPTTAIRVSRPAVKLDFTKQVKVELVPAYARDADDVYWIPDPTDSSKWMKSAPQKHLDYVNAAQRRRSNTKTAVRLLKLWKAVKAVPISPSI